MGYIRMHILYIYIYNFNTYIKIHLYVIVVFFRMQLIWCCNCDIPKSNHKRPEVTCSRKVVTF